MDFKKEIFHDSKDSVCPYGCPFKHVEKSKKGCYERDIKTKNVMPTVVLCVARSLLVTQNTTVGMPFICCFYITSQMTIGPSMNLRFILGSIVI